MITNIAELLNRFREKEVESLDKQKIKHGPTIGSMYEGLTQNILERSLFEGMDLRVVSGFIEFEEEKFSKQLDCLLVCGEGKQIPHTNNYIYEIANVIAVIEVKKTLYTKDLTDAYQNLFSINSMRDHKAFHFSSFQRAYELILGERLPERQNLSSYSLWKQLIYHSLIAENVLPIRMVLGYHGFTSENNFRNAFIDFIEVNLTKQGFGPSCFPNLIISNEFSIIKTTAEPYYKAVNNEKWHLFGTHSGNPIIPMLEMIYTRLTSRYGLSSQIFGEDLTLESIKPLIDAKGINHNGKNTWAFYVTDMTEEDLETFPKIAEWMPTRLREAQARVFSSLLLRNIAYDDEYWNQIIAKEFNCSFSEIVEELRSLGLAAIDLESNEVIPITKEGRIGYLKDKDIWIAGDNVNNRLNTWLLKNGYEITPIYNLS